MFEPEGISVDARGQLWVTENDETPKRISLWNATSGQHQRDFWGAASYAPMMAPDPQNPQAILVVSHRTSEIKRFFVKDVEFSGKKVRYLFPSEEPEAQVFAAAKAGGKYGWRDLVLARDGTLYVTDEVAGAVLRRVPGGPLEEWAKGLSSPSGLALSPSGELFVTEEGTGRLSRVAPDGRAVVVAEGLGQARDALFLDRRRVLVTDRAGGNVWLVTLPPGR